MKYIDAEKLKAEIQRRSLHDYEAITADEPKYRTHYKLGRYEGLRDLIDIIESLQQEQPDLPGIEESGIPGKDYIPVDWVDACEMYGKWKIVKQEQPEVDLEKEIDAIWNPRFNLGWDEHSALSMNHAGFASIASHFYALGRNAKKEE